MNEEICYSCQFGTEMNNKHMMIILIMNKMIVFIIFIRE